jgi:hypothetical protein
MLSPRGFIKEEFTQRNHFLMIRIQKDLSDLLTDGGAPGLAGDFAGDTFTSQVSFQTANLSGLPASLNSLKGNKQGQNKPPSTVK